MIFLDSKIQRISEILPSGHSGQAPDDVPAYQGAGTSPSLPNYGILVETCQDGNVVFFCKRSVADFPDE